jgi:hypothetical protein
MIRRNRIRPNALFECQVHKLDELCQLTSLGNQNGFLSRSNRILSFPQNAAALFGLFHLKLSGTFRQPVYIGVAPMPGSTSICIKFQGVHLIHYQISTKLFVVRNHGLGNSMPFLLKS